MANDSGSGAQWGIVFQVVGALFVALGTAYGAGIISGRLSTVETTTRENTQGLADATKAIADLSTAVKITAASVDNLKEVYVADHRK